MFHVLQWHELFALHLAPCHPVERQTEAPRFCTLQCRESAATGGESVLVSGAELLAALSNEELKSLMQPGGMPTDGSLDRWQVKSFKMFETKKGHNMSKKFQKGRLSAVRLDRFLFPKVNWMKVWSPWGDALQLMAAGWKLARSRSFGWTRINRSVMIFFLHQLRLKPDFFLWFFHMFSLMTQDLGRKMWLVWKFGSLLFYSMWDSSRRSGPLGSLSFCGSQHASAGYVMIFAYNVHNIILTKSRCFPLCTWNMLLPWEFFIQRGHLCFNSSYFHVFFNFDI